MCSCHGHLPTQGIRVFLSLSPIHPTTTYSHVSKDTILIKFPLAKKKEVGHAFSGSFCSSARTGVYCGPLQSRRAMELLSASRWAATAGADARRRRRRRLLESSASVGSKDQFAISFFFEVLCVSWSGQLASVSFYNIFVFVRSLYAFLIS